MIVILGSVTVAATTGVRGNHAAHPLIRRFPYPVTTHPARRRGVPGQLRQSRRETPRSR